MQSFSNFFAASYAAPSVCAGSHLMWALAALTPLTLTGVGHTTPPDYMTFQRDQRVEYTPRSGNLLRVWLASARWGDGIVIQLPTSARYDLDRGAGDRAPRERIDIVLDPVATAGHSGDIRGFLKALYPNPPVLVEHVLITHPAADILRGVTGLLEADAFSVRHIYHNGLAAFAAGVRGLPSTGRPTRAGIYDFEAGQIAGALGLLSDDRATIDAAFIIDDRADLAAAHQGSEFTGDYQRLAAAVTRTTTPHAVSSFNRTFRGTQFPADAADAGRLPQNLSVEVLWPQASLRPYGDWRATNNGNSVMFRIRYGDFEMLFAGNHDERSQRAVLAALPNAANRLRADVLQVPQGASGGIREFFAAVNPVVAVASPGSPPAQPASEPANAWPRVSPNVIRWLGGAHRVYLTELHERRVDWRRVDWRHMDGARKSRRLYERAHLLIETDGSWFRLVEVPLDWADPNTPPTVRQTRRSDGTRWIGATTARKDDR